MNGNVTEAPADDMCGCRGDGRLRLLSPRQPAAADARR